MNVIVCVKQVPRSINNSFNSRTNVIERKSENSCINPQDMFALEAALKIKDEVDCKVFALTMGVAYAENILREAISMGVDKAILISDRAFAGSDTLATSYALAQAIIKINDVHLVICGKHSSDGDTGHVGPGIAEFLGLPHVENVTDIKCKIGYVITAQDLPEGLQKLETSYPAVLIISKNANEPRYPSLRGANLAKKAIIEVWGAKDLDISPEVVGKHGSPTRVVKIRDFKPKNIETRKLDMSDSAIEELVQLLKKTCI